MGIEPGVRDVLIGNYPSARPPLASLAVKVSGITPEDQASFHRIVGGQGQTFTSVPAPMELFVAGAELMKAQQAAETATPPKKRGWGLGFWIPVWIRDCLTPPGCGPGCDATPVDEIVTPRRGGKLGKPDLDSDLQTRGEEDCTITVNPTSEILIDGEPAIDTSTGPDPFSPMSKDGDRNNDMVPLDAHSSPAMGSTDHRVPGQD